MIIWHQNIEKLLLQVLLFELSTGKGHEYRKEKLSQCVTETNLAIEFPLPCFVNQNIPPIPQRYFNHSLNKEKHVTNLTQIEHEIRF